MDTKESILGMIMAGKYKNPPLVESVCEFTFPEEMNWDSTITGLFYDQIKEKFPTKDTKTKILCDGTETDAQECPHFESQDYTVFSNDEKIFDVGITVRKLVIRALKPYSKWEAYKKVITDNFSKLNNIIKSENCEIRFSYSNIIDQKDKGNYSPEKISENFYFAPENSSTVLPNEWDDFIVGCAYKNIKDNSFCRITLSSAIESEKKYRGYFLSVVVVTIKPENSPNVPKWMEKSHKKIKGAFEGCIKDKLRESFG